MSGNKMNRGVMSSYSGIYKNNQCEFLKVEEKEIFDYEIKGVEKTFNSSVMKVHFGYGGTRKESAKHSTAKYREKKKLELTELEQDVKALENELTSTDNELHNLKKKIAAGLETLAKMNQLSSNENIEIYNELEVLMGKNNHKSTKEYPESHHELADFDKINLLIDTLKYRIGASGRERQTKLSYQFKSIVNTLFPALYRYMLFCCMKKIDFFSNGQPKPNEWEWTNELMGKVILTPDQKEYLETYSRRLGNVLEITTKGVLQLGSIKEKLKQEGMEMEIIEDQIREMINPLQCAFLTIFAEKSKYRRELLLDGPFYHSESKVQEDSDNLIIERGIKGRKKVKLSV